MKASKDLSAKYYQKRMERLQKNLVKSIKIFGKKKCTKKDNMVMIVIKICQKVKNKI